MDIPRHNLALHDWIPSSLRITSLTPLPQQMGVPINGLNLFHAQWSSFAVTGVSLDLKGYKSHLSFFVCTPPFWWYTRVEQSSPACRCFWEFRDHKWSVPFPWTWDLITGWSFSKQILVSTQKFFKSLSHVAVNVFMWETHYVWSLQRIVFLSFRWCISHVEDVWKCSCLRGRQRLPESGVLRGESKKEAGHLASIAPEGWGSSGGSTVHKILEETGLCLCLHTGGR